MKVLIIGGTGNISKYVVRYFKEKGETVSVVNRGRKPYFEINGVEYIHCDVECVDEFVDSICEKSWDIIIDFCVYEPKQINNRIATCIPKCSQYVFISSAATYEQSDDKIYSEEDQIYNSKWEYGYNKSKAEEVLTQYAEENHNFKYTIIRPGLIYSEMWIPDTIYDSCCNPGYSIHRILNEQEMIVYDDPEWYYTFMHAEDFAHNLYWLLSKREAVNSVFNMVGQEHIYPKDVLIKLGTILNKDIRIVEIPYGWAVENGNIGVPVQHQHGMISNSKIKNVLGESYRSVLHIEDAISKYVELFENHQELMYWDNGLRNAIEQMIIRADATNVAKHSSLLVSDKSKLERINSKLYVSMCKKIAYNKEDRRNM